jgi:membrane dipeptidase
MSAPDPVAPNDADLCRQLGCSAEALALTRSCEIVDMHVDTYIPARLWGYDPMSRHRGGPLGRRHFGHVDLPRAVDGGLGAAMWSITTNPFRSAAGRWRAFQGNLRNLRALVAASGGRLAVARNHSEYVEARAAGAHVCLISIQGANALDAAPDGLASVTDDLMVRTTLVHLTNSTLGATSSPFHAGRRNKGLSEIGRRFVEQSNQLRVFVDLAHIHERGFWDAVDVHDRSQPLLVTHTGVDGVKPHWRNLSDRQVKAVADTGGTIGIIFQAGFLARPGGPRNGAMVVEHMEHVIQMGGEDCVSVGSDFDGAIVPPRDLAGADTYPRLVQHMLDRRWSEGRIRKVLATNFLRCLRELRPG